MFNKIYSVGHFNTNVSILQLGCLFWKCYVLSAYKVEIMTGSDLTSRKEWMSDIVEGILKRREVCVVGK